MKKITTIVSLMVILFTATTQADEFREAATKLCDKMTMCITEQMSAEDDVPPQMKEMATTMAKNMCASFYEMESFLIDDNYKQAALACMNSASEKSCESLQEGLKTPECDKFEKLIEQTTR